MKKIHITELVLRDGHQCQIATRLRTEDMLPICPQLDALGFWSIEAWGGATFDACVRFLKEDPWERLKLLRKSLPNSRIQMLLRGQNLLGYRHYSDDVVDAFVKQSANNGVDVFRIFDAMNDVRNLTTSIKSVKKYKKHAMLFTVCSRKCLNAKKPCLSRQKRGLPGSKTKSRAFQRLVFCAVDVFNTHMMAVLKFGSQKGK